MKITKIPCGEKISDDFHIKLNGMPAEAYAARVSAMPFNCIWPNHQRPPEQTEEASFLSFEMNEAVTVELIASKEFREAVIRPLSENICPEIDKKIIKFTIEHPGQYTVELDGMHNALHIFANPEMDFKISPNDDNVIYFPAGVHRPGVIKLESNQTLYIDRNAVVYGAVLAVNAENIRILGYGILDGSWEERNNNSVLVPLDFSRRNTQMDIYSPIMKELPVSEISLPATGSVLIKNKEQYLEFLEKWHVLNSCIHLYKCSNVEINGIIMRDAPCFTIIAANCQNTIFENLKLIGMWRYNSDGIDIFNSQNCIIRNSFLRNFDDCVVLKGIVGWDTQNMENILVENCVIWCDWGRSLEIGAETCAPEYRNIIFRDCDCIHNSSAALSVHSCDYTNVHDILYEDIRVEYSKYDEKPVYQSSDDAVFSSEHNIPLLIYAGFDGETYFSCERQKGTISRIIYHNIQAYTDNEAALPSIVLQGYNKDHTINEVSISGLTLNDKPVNGKSMLNANEFALNIKL